MTNKTEDLLQAVYEANHKLATSEKNYRHLFDRNPMPMWILEKSSFHFLKVNQAAILHYGYSEEEFLSMRAHDIRPAQDVQKFEDFGFNLGNGAYSAGVWQHKKKAGSIIQVEIRIDDISMMGIEGLLVVATDVTNLVLSTYQMKEQNEELSKINSELDRLVYSLSHELRAPIANMRGLVNAIKEDDDKNENDQLMSVLESRITQLDEVIKDILLYSKNSRTDIDFEIIDFKKIIGECIINSTYLNGVGKIKIESDVNVGADFLSDRIRISIILNNLLSNAIKYHNLDQESPSVFIKVWHVEQQLFIDIMDNGSGIEIKHQEKIFDMFYRGSTMSDGSGLGLFIVREMIQKLGATIIMQSIPKKGTNFLITLPMHDADSKVLITDSTVLQLI